MFKNHSNAYISWYVLLKLGTQKKFGHHQRNTTKADSYDGWLLRIPQMSQVLLLPGKVSSPSATTCLEIFSPVSKIFLNFPHLLLPEDVADPARRWQKISLEVVGEEEEDEKGGGEHQHNFDGASHRQL